MKEDDFQKAIQNPMQQPAEIDGSTLKTERWGHKETPVFQGVSVDFS